MSSEASPEPLVLRADEDGVATLTLNRAPQRNALCETMIGDLETALGLIASDATVRVVVLTGAGSNFCAGHDLKEMRSRPDQVYYERLFERCGRMMLSLLKLPQPVIAKVRGIATAAGCQLVAISDLAVASQGARFATSGINVGLFCSTPAVPLSRNVSRKRAFEMLMTGDFMDATSARESGLVNRVVPDAELDAAVVELARRITEKAPAVVAAGKRTFYRQLGLGMMEAFDFAARTMACDMMAVDAREGIDAFIEKRPPVWQGASRGD